MGHTVKRGLRLCQVSLLPIEPRECGGNFTLEGSEVVVLHNPQRLTIGESSRGLFTEGGVGIPKVMEGDRLAMLIVNRTPELEGLSVNGETRVVVAKVEPDGTKVVQGTRQEGIFAERFAPVCRSFIGIKRLIESS